MAAGPTQESDPLAAHSLSASELKQMLAAERSGEAAIVYRDEDGALQLFSVASPEHAGDVTMTIGRRPETDLSIAWDTEVSGLHAELQHLGGELTILDDGLSTNGTYLNGNRISGRQRLRDDDRIRVGKTILVYKAAQASLLGATALAGARPVLQLTDTQRKVLLALCRPYKDASFATPATNQEIAGEVFLSVDAVKMHLRTLFAKFELADLPQNQKRATLVERAMQSGAISQRDLA